MNGQRLCREFQISKSDFLFGKSVRTTKQRISIYSYSEEKSKWPCQQGQKSKWGKDAEAELITEEVISEILPQWYAICLQKSIKK